MTSVGGRRTGGYRGFPNASLSQINGCGQIAQAAVMKRCVWPVDEKERLMASSSCAVLEGEAPSSLVLFPVPMLESFGYGMFYFGRRPLQILKALDPALVAFYLCCSREEEDASVP